MEQVEVLKGLLSLLTIEIIGPIAIGEHILVVFFKLLDHSFAYWIVNNYSKMKKIRNRMLHIILLGD